MHIFVWLKRKDTENKYYKEEKLGYVIVDIEIEIESQTSLPTALVKVAQSMLKFLLNNDAFDPLHSQMTAYNIEAIL